MSQQLDPAFSDGKDTQPLRSVAPACYRSLLEAFKSYNLHPYDVKAEALPENNGGYAIILRFGEGMKYSRQQAISGEQALQPDAALAGFFQTTAEACKQALIADYYKMTKS